MGREAVLVAPSARGNADYSAFASAIGRRRHRRQSILVDELISILSKR